MSGGLSDPGLSVPGGGAPCGPAAPCGGEARSAAVPRGLRPGQGRLRDRPAQHQVRQETTDFVNYDARANLMVSDLTLLPGSSTVRCFGRIM